MDTYPGKVLKLVKKNWELLTVGHDKLYENLKTNRVLTPAYFVFSQVSQVAEFSIRRFQLDFWNVLV